MYGFIYMLIVLFYTALPSDEASVSEDGSNKLITLDLDSLNITELSCNETAKLMVNVTSGTRYVLFQAHSQKTKLLMSYIPPIDDLSYSNHVLGLDLGLVYLLDLASDSATVYLKNVGQADTSVALKAQGYGSRDAIPGGCNMEFEVEIAPYLKASFDVAKVSVEYQRASIGYPRSYNQPSCDTSVMYLAYDVYAYYMDERSTSAEDYFAAIQLMTDYAAIVENSIKLPERAGKKLSFAIPTYRRHGVVLNVVVHYQYNGSNRSFVPYVPIVSYGCNLNGGHDSCSNILTSFEWVLGVMGALAGLFVCFFGHRFFTITTFSFGFTTLSLLLFIPLERFENLEYIEVVSIVLVVGVIGGFASFTVWWFTRSPFFTVLLASLNLGFLVACVVYFTPLALDHALARDEAYWPLFSAFVLVIPILFIGFNLTKQLHITACSVIGSYAVIVLIDRYAGGVLVYVVVNVFRRAVRSNYQSVITVIPFQTTDIILAFSWLVTAAVGIVWQWIREKNRPPFPVPPSPVSLSPTFNEGTSQQQQPSERDPLLRHNPHEFRKKRKNYGVTPPDEERPLPYT